MNGSCFRKKSVINCAGQRPAKKQQFKHTAHSDSSPAMRVRFSLKYPKQAWKWIQS